MDSPLLIHFICFCPFLKHSMTVGRNIKVVHGKKNSKVAITLTYTQEKNVCNAYKDIFQLISWVNLIISDDHSLSYNVAGLGHSTLAGSFKNEKNCNYFFCRGLSFSNNLLLAFFLLQVTLACFTLFCFSNKHFLPLPN